MAVGPQLEKEHVVLPGLNIASSSIRRASPRNTADRDGQEPKSYKYQQHPNAYYQRSSQNGASSSALALLDLESGQTLTRGWALVTNGAWRKALIVATCLSWIFASSMAILVNKHIMVDLKFSYPVTVAWLGLLTTTLASYASVNLLLPTSSRQSISMRNYMTRVMPTGFFMALTFHMGNTAYLHLTVAFVQMLKAFCPVITMLLLFLFKLERATMRLVVSVVIISWGVGLASYGEMHMSVVGVAAMLTSVVSECVRLVLTQHLLVGLNFHPLEGLMYIGSASTFWLMVQASVWEWRSLLLTSSYSLIAQHPAQFTLAALAGFGVNSLAIMVIKLSSSLTLKVLGTVKDAALVMVGVLLLHEQVSSLQLAGYSISLVGFIMYNVIKASGPTQVPKGSQGVVAKQQ